MTDPFALKFYTPIQNNVVLNFVICKQSFSNMMCHILLLSNFRYALFVLDNQNLQDIWDFKTHPNLTILRGTVFFHQNHKLCLHKIDELVRHIGHENKVDEVDISKLNNGDQVACK